MSERFVRGWKGSAKELRALVGAKSLDARTVLKSKANSRCREDVVMTLGDGDEDEGREIAERALTEIFEGRLRPKGAYEYGRVTELVLNHTATLLGPEILLQLTYHVPNDTPGRWNPMLKKLALPKLAKLWAATNLGFPWAKSKLGWPTWTVFDEAASSAILAELKSITKKSLAALPDVLLADDSAADEAAECRAELWVGLKTLRSWLMKARGSSLILSMDGDQ
jgi:hypothetical protein